jgi:hypothetical protein
MSRRSLHPFYLLLVLAPLVLLSPVIFTGKALFWGTPALQFVPWRQFAWEALQSGNLPLWNPLSGMGAPLYANYQSALAYPPTWFLFLLSWLGGIEWSAWGQAVLVVLHWVIAAFGMARLANGLGLGRLAQVLSGLAYGLGGYLVSRAGFLSINAALAWLPWIFYYVAQLASPALRGDAGWGKALVKFGLVAGLQLLSGHAQTTWYTCLGAFLWAGYWGWLDGSGGDASRKMRIAGFFRAWLLLGLGYLLGAALAAVQLIPTSEYLSQSQRASEVAFDYAMTYSFWAWRFLTLIAPDLFGNPVRGNYWGYANYWEDALYIGLLPLLLALGAAVRWALGARRSHRQVSDTAGEHITAPVRYEAVPFLLALTLVSFLLALGKNTPIFPWLYRYIPTFDMFQAPTRFSLWAAFALALLAGFGAQRWRRPERRALYWTRLGTAGAAAITIGAGLAWYFMGEVSPTFIRAAALAGLWGVGAGALSLLAPPSRPTDDSKLFLPDNRSVSRWTWVVGIFVAADLIVAGWGLNPGIETRFYSQEPEGVEELRVSLAGRRLYLPGGQEEAIKFERFLRFDTYTPDEDWGNLRSALLPNIQILDHIASLNNFDPLVPGRYSTWMEMLAQAPNGERAKLLDMSGAGAVEGINLAAPAGVTFHPLPAGTGSRARWVPCAMAVESETASRQALRSPSFDPNQQVIIETDESTPLLECLDSSFQGEVTLLSETPNRLVFKVKSESPGWLLLSDTWYPGWRAQVNGEGAPLYRADYLFRAVPLPAGDHEVVFVYRPLPLWIGSWISLACWLGMLSYLIYARLGDGGADHKPDEVLAEKAS